MMEQHIIEFLTSKLSGLKGIYLFGSYANNTARPDSDYDIAFLLERPVKTDRYEQFLMQQELTQLLSSDVDLVDLQQTDLDFRFIIVSTGKRIFCGDRTFCESFEMITYSMYLRFEEERKPIIEDIKKRGSIYG